MAAEASTLV